MHTCCLYCIDFIIETKQYQDEGSDYMKEMKQLFDQTNLHGLKLKNRFFRSATWDGLVRPDGSLTDEVYEIYENVAKGGVGTIVTALTDVSPYDWALDGSMRMCSDLLIPDYKKLTDLVHKYDTKIFIQLNMNKYFRMDRRISYVDINDMTKDDIAIVVRDFTQAAIRSAKAGFDGIQLHLAYGWILGRFLNPYFNQRTDEYGQTTENRCRIVGKIMESIRKELPTMPIITKFSFFDQGPTISASGSKDGKFRDVAFEVEEGVQICMQLEKFGIDAIEILGGHCNAENDASCLSCYEYMGKAVREKVSVPLILTGNNHNLDVMERILNEENIDYFALSRPLIREPDLIRQWENGRKEDAKCISCNGCYRTHGKRCVFI